MARWRRWRQRRAERRGRGAAKARADRSPIDGDGYDAGAWRAVSGVQGGTWAPLPPAASGGMIDRLVAGPRRRRR